MQALNAVHLQAAGVHIKGFAPSLDIMQQYRVCLAPIRFGAGLKGKIVDSWAHGLPVCTTPVGAEGMFPESDSTAEGFPVLETQVRPSGPGQAGLAVWHKLVQGRMACCMQRTCWRMSRVVSCSRS